MLDVNLCGVKMRNPTMLAAGVLGITASSLNRVYHHGAGAVVTKSFSLEPNMGYKNPTIVEVPYGLINAMGLSNPGVESFKEELYKIEDRIPVVASIYGSSPSEFVKVALEVQGLVDMIELNISCPHAMEGYGATIGQDPQLTFKVVEAVKEACKVPVAAKLTPNVTDIKEIALKAEEAGCDAITLINSLGPAMKIDLKTGKPILSNKFGGLSGPAIKPIAIRCVYEVYETVDVPLIGVGGITDYKDVVEFLYAGASAIQIGSAIFYHGLGIFKKVCDDLKAFMKREGFKSINKMVGLAHG
ncbi:MAG TPA: dihydroorotate dehydrogenase [Methanothermobacter sp.]|uniref:Dihydroorotate dehydrogenase n=1 Tax=Methanothermobacter tenebrarum TaxID=680118 RepID=A0ABN6P9H1_9EURY|nr:dihydroorotate dehydrogenase [Methanothermobacter tenebrarum]MDD3454042.1 dihydroorotate dehydrogenase [Methanobacteriales archaeon]MDI6882327.1 dihydroorotate dehydrogenase [Methanothermobacter sp.]MDX9693590.1 dihydroorotate dehydrogenase [Methanothermobacter sp.]BDH78836.1 dihydroorotate dehydrogenase [Methanothermobacter tenebrarum]HHW17044.1 dihydroorotate dehydrogenase [Methanothermobacter sp.]